VRRQRGQKRDCGRPQGGILFECKGVAPDEVFGSHGLVGIVEINRNFLAEADCGRVDFLAHAVARFQTLKLATGMAAASGGRLKADVASVFAELQEKARKGGPRGATRLEEAYRIIGNVEGPIILVDDVWTTGGHLRAACWKLASPSRSIILACTVAHTTHEHVDKPVDVQEHILDFFFNEEQPERQFCSGAASRKRATK
jgi:hypothetical protein